MKLALDTLGCKLNQAETELFARQLLAAGHRLVSPTDEADVYILNTCTVTHIADAKSRHWLRLAHRRNPEALVVATGCYAQRVPRELAQIEGVGLIVDNVEKPYLWQLLSESGRLGHPASVPWGLAPGCQSALRTRAFIKVQDGCNNFCAYCIVPLVRGGARSLPVSQVVAEVRQRVVEGYQEVVLTGTEIGSYHDDGFSLKDLLGRILVETNVARLRLSSLQPQEITSELIGLWRDRRLCPHFHLSLQSGSDAVLSRMARCYSVSDYERAVSLIRAQVPSVAITTDVIVGFPGETESEFEESYQLCRQLGFARIHVFAYSRRSGTQASRFPHQINTQVKKERSQKMLALHKESAQSFRQQFLGEVMPVLWEQPTNGIWSGYTDNYIKVYIRGDEDLTNKLLSVKLVELFNRDGVWALPNQ